MHNRVRALKPAVLVTGRGMPIEGEELIDASLRRMRGAVEYVHQKTLDLINQHKDPYEIMRSVELPPELRVGQGYGKVSWAARTFFEEYTGWFQRRSTAELYGADPADATVALASELGADAVLEIAQRKMADGEIPTAIRLAAAVLQQGESREATQLLLDATEKLLETGSESFWEHGWLVHEIERLRGELGS